MRHASSAKEPLGKRNIAPRIKSRGDVKGKHHAEAGLACQDHIRRYTVVSGIADQHPTEGPLRAENAGGDSSIGGIVNSSMSIGWVIAPVLDIVCGEDSNADGLQKLRHQKRGGRDVSRSYSPGREPH